MPITRMGRVSPKKICFPRGRCFPKEAFVLDNCIIKTYMNMRRLSVMMFLTLALGGTAWAQQAFGPAQQLGSHEVAADGTVTFRLKAPAAKRVQVTCDG